MTDPWSEAIKEAYASAPTSLVILSTLELRHPAFQDAAGNPVAARVVHDHADLSARLENDAEMNASEVVTFQKCAFSFSLPESSDRLPHVQVAIDNVSREITGYLENAVSQRAPVEVTYREFLSDDPLAGPHYVLNGLTFSRASANVFRVSATASFFDFMNRQFPNQLYTMQRFPGLVR